MGHTTSSAANALICCGIAAAFMVSGCNGDRSYSLGGGVRIAIADKMVLELEGARAVDDPRPSGGRSRFGFALTARF